MRKKILILAFFLTPFLIFVKLANAILINEINYNPEGEDNNREYIEILTNSSLENFTIEDLSGSDRLISKKVVNSSFALIVEEGFNYSEVNASVYSAGATIGNGLNNENDALILRDYSGEILDVIVYNKELGGNGNNMSLCRNGISFLECRTTPGYKNLFLESVINFSIKINELLPDPIGDDRDEMPNGEWVEFYNYGNDLDLEGFFIKDQRNTTLIISEENVIDSTIAKKNSFIVVYMNGRSLLNNDGFEKIYFGIGNKIIDSISYSSTSEGKSLSIVDGVIKKTQPTPGEENFEEENQLDSYVNIEEVYLGNDNKANFGDLIRAKIRVFKGDTTKNSVKVYVDKLSKQSSFNVYGKFVNISFIVPIQLELNCNEKFNDGSYELIAEGLDGSDKKEITIEGGSSYCKTSKSNNKKPSKEKNEGVKIYEGNYSKRLQSEFNREIESVINKEGEVVFESSDIKARRSALYFFSITILMILMYYLIGVENGEGTSKVNNRDTWKSSRACRENDEHGSGEIKRKRGY